MKKILSSFLLICLLSAMLFACGVDSEERSDDSAYQADSSTAEHDSVSEIELYDSVLQNKINAVNEDGNEISFKDYILEINGSVDITLNGKAVVDMDGDGSSEMVISLYSQKQIENILLRYYEGKVYIFGFFFRNFYDLNTDGSFSFNSYAPDTYGECKLTFKGSKMEQVELWRIVNDGTAEAEYYISSKQVTKEEMEKYQNENPKTKVEFSDIELNLGSDSEESKSDSELAIEMCNSVLSNEITAINLDDNKKIKFRDYIFGINNSSYDINVKGKATVDLDKDGIDEVIVWVDSKTLPDVNIMLRYYEGKVYVWAFEFRSFFYLNTDGTFDWSQKEPFVYGESKLTFDGAKPVETELWRIENGLTPEVEYYINNEPVTGENISKYFSENEKTRVVYSPLELNFLYIDRDNK